MYELSKEKKRRGKNGTDRSEKQNTLLEQTKPTDSYKFTHTLAILFNTLMLESCTQRCV